MPKAVQAPAETVAGPISSDQAKKVHQELTEEHNQGLIRLYRTGGEMIEVHPSTVQAHLKAGWAL